MEKEIVYAIDFGTSNSLLSAVVDGMIEPTISLDQMNSDESILRSLMYFPRKGEPDFGQAAIKSYINEDGDGRFIRSIKKYLPAKSFTGTNINNKQYSLEKLIGRFLHEMKSRADKQFGIDVKSALFGRPAKFSFNPEEDELAESRLRDAAKLAGFKNIEFFPEPLAAAYDYKKSLTGEKIVLVVDLGGGTSDCTVIKVHQGKYDPSDVLSLGGISIAGDALDGCIMSTKIAPHLGSKIKYQFPMSKNVLTMPNSLKSYLSSPADITLMSKSDIMYFLEEVRKCTIAPEDNKKLSQLFDVISDNLGFSIFEEIEKTKKGVCENQQHDFLFTSGDLKISEKFSYQEFLEFTESKLKSIMDMLDETVLSAQINNSDIDLICCTGGTSKVPAIKNELIKRFGAEKVQTFKNFHSVSQGLAGRALEIFS